MRSAYHSEYVLSCATPFICISGVFSYPKQVNKLSLPSQPDFYISVEDDKAVLEKTLLQKWCCEKCPYATIDWRRLERHLHLHKVHQKFVCVYCDYSVPTLKWLQLHAPLHERKNEHLLNTQHVANLCKMPQVAADIAAATGYVDACEGYGLKDNHDFYEHSDEYVQPSAKTFKCTACPFTAGTRELLSKHMRGHVVKMQHTCTHCTFSSDSSDDLAAHVALHFDV